ncbi:hypothetical protein [Nonomuraea sp. NPDC050691]|uniref:hypothetical protein n=1 Tax=Nonomuraea sp. NPDC050691 TaxID=3155661 RepID=UPI0033F8C4BD
MPATDEAAAEPVTSPLRREWRRFRSRGRMIAMSVAAMVVILLGLLLAVVHPSCSEGPVEVPCPVAPVGPDGQAVSDTFFFVHRPLGENGGITARLTSMTGIITYPPPDHDQIVPGLVPWAKAGIILKDGTRQGSSYAALMLTGGHGVRMQYDYVHDVAGRPGGVSPVSPRWLRLTRSGGTITGYESTDGAHWEKVGTAHLSGLPPTVQVGLFVASPGDLTLERTPLGASLPASRFTQASAVFDTVRLAGAPLAGPGGAPAAGWGAGPVGAMGGTDWELHHRAPGLVESHGTFTVTGTGDIGPVADSGRTVGSTLVGLPIGLIIVIVVAVRFATAGHRTGRTGRTGPAALSGRVLAAKAMVTGAAAFLTGLVAAGVVVPVGAAILRGNGIGVLPVSALGGLRVVVGVAALVAVAAVLALALGALTRRSWTAILVAVCVIVLPYVLGTLPLLPDVVSVWLLRLTPAAAFAVQQTLREYPQVLAFYAPPEGYFPLSGAAGFAVLSGYAMLGLGLAVLRQRRGAAPLRFGGGGRQRS